MCVELRRFTCSIALECSICNSKCYDANPQMLVVTLFLASILQFFRRILTFWYHRFNVSLEFTERVPQQEGSHGHCSKWIWWSNRGMFMSFSFNGLLLRFELLIAIFYSMASLIFTVSCIEWYWMLWFFLTTDALFTPSLSGWITIESITVALWEWQLSIIQKKRKKKKNGDKHIAGIWVPLRRTNSNNNIVWNGAILNMYEQA